MEGLGSVTVSGDSPEAHGHRRGMGRPAEEWRQSVQRGARNQGQSLTGPSLCCSVSPIFEPVAALSGPQGLPVCGIRRLRPRRGGSSGQGQARLKLPWTERSRLSVTALGVCCLMQETRREEGC